MSRPLGISAALNHTDSLDDLNKFQDRLDSEFSVAIVDNKSDIPLIAAYAARHPNTSIIGRLYDKMDGGFHTKPLAEKDKDKEFLASPEDWMNEIAPIADITNAWLYVMNEPNTNVDPVKEPDYFPRLSNWTSRWMDISIPKRRRSVMWNFGDRQPMIVNGLWQDWCWGHLRRMASEPDLFMIGMHLYGPDPVTEHIEAYLKTCEMLKITPIPLFATEMGFDTVGGSKESGYHDRVTAPAFAAWFGDTFTDENALAPYIRRKVFRGGAIYIWNNLWPAFDVQKDTAFQDAIVTINLQPATVVTPPAPKPEPIKPIDIKFPSDFATRSVERFVKPTRGNLFVRSAPSTIGTDKPSLLVAEGQRCDIILATNLKPEETTTSFIEGTRGTWLPIKINNVSGWIFGGFVTAEVIPEKTATGEVPVVVLPPPPPEVITPPPAQETPVVKKFIWSMTFTGTEEENRKALEGIQLFMSNAWKVESKEVAL